MSGKTWYPQTVPAVAVKCSFPADGAVLSEVAPLSLEGKGCEINPIRVVVCIFLVKEHCTQPGALS